jgi:hypothetical protein
MNRYYVLRWTLIYGVIWNLLGWLGNVFLLGAAWDAVGAELQAAWSPPWPGVMHEALSVVSDFVYALAFTWLYARGNDKSAAAAIRLVAVVWLAGAAMTYLTIVNAGFLPWHIAAKSGLLALLIFLATAPLIARAD